MAHVDHAAEQSVLGALLISASRDDRDTIAGILSTARGEDFLDETDQRLFEAARALYREGTPPDPVTVLGKLGLDKDTEARAYIAKLINETPTAANWREYATLAHDESVLAMIQGEAIRIANAPTLRECRESVAAIESAMRSGHRIRSKTLEELLIEFADRQAPDHRQKQRFPIGFPGIDHNAKLSEGKFVMLAGLPSDGKTALALQWALKCAASAPTGLFSLETDDETVGDRLVTHGIGIDYDKIVDQRLTDLDWVQFAEQMPLYAKRNLRVFDESRLTPDQIAAVSTAYGLKVVFVDYGQLIETDHERGVPRAEQLARVSIALKTFARETDTMVVVLLQLKELQRVKVKGGKFRTLAPTMEDIGETRQWSKDADVILILSRPDESQAESTEDNPYVETLSYDKHRYLKIAKNKEGRRGTVTLYFDGKHQTFYVNGTQPEERRPENRKKQPVGNPGQQSLEALPKSAEKDMPF